jgi:flavin-dependent dehydrogenase
MTMAYDAIVVGARCAGSPLAMLLARKGYRVLLVDKTSFPSDTISTHYIQQPGVAKLKNWGLLDRIRASNCPPILKCTLDVGPFTLAGSAPPADGVAEAYCTRRTILDQILVDAAVEAGAEFRPGFMVQGLVTDDDRVVGIRGREGESNVKEAARIVVGADGMRSMVANTVKAAQYKMKPPLACYYYTYWSGVTWDAIDLSIRDSRYVGGFPTNDGLTCIFVGWKNSEFPKYRAAVEANYLDSVNAVPGLSERLANARREYRFMGTAELPNFFRKPYGPGWALVGDAGYHRDPFTGQGITDALSDADRVAQAIGAGLSGSTPLDQALARYELERNEAVQAMYDYTCHLAALEPPSVDEQRFFAALRSNQPETDRLFGAILAGTVPLAEFFGPESTRRIIGGA